VGKRDEGFYVLLQFTCAPDVIKEIERRFRVTDLVLKFLSVRIDEKLKKIEKRKKQRDKRAKRRPAPGGASSGKRISGASRDAGGGTDDGGCGRGRERREGEITMAEGRGGRPVSASQQPTGTDKASMGKKQYFRRKKVCRFCVEKVDDINYKDVKM